MFRPKATSRMTKTPNFSRDNVLLIAAKALSTLVRTKKLASELTQKYGILMPYNSNFERKAKIVRFLSCVGCLVVGRTELSTWNVLS